MRQFFICIIGFFAALAWSEPARAQGSYPGEPPKEINGQPFRKYVNSHAYFDEMAKEAMQYEALLGSCGTPEKVDRLNAGRPQILTKLPQLGTPPQWMEVLRISGCEEPVKRAVLVLYVNRMPLFLPLVSGNGLSRYDVILQRDVIKALIPVERALGVRAGCPKDAAVRILNTKTLSKKEIEGGLTWEEEWQLSTCKGEKRVRVSYTSQEGSGTRFQIRQAVSH